MQYNFATHHYLTLCNSKNLMFALNSIISLFIGKFQPSYLQHSNIPYHQCFTARSFNVKICEKYVIICLQYSLCPVIDKD